METEAVKSSSPRARSGRRFPSLPLLAAAAVLIGAGRAHAARQSAVTSSCEIESPFVRVGLMRFAGASSARLAAEPGARLVDANGLEIDTGAGPWNVVATS